MVKDRKAKANMAERIANDFLLQLTYSIISSIILLFIYNGRLFKYGNSVGVAMEAIIWSLFSLCAVAAIFCFYLWKTKKENKFKILAIYLFVTALGFFWCIGAEKLAYYISAVIPFMSYFANAKRLIEILFAVIGLSVPAEIIIYSIRLKNLKSK